MPLLEVRKINTHTYMGFWQLTESLATLQQQLAELVGNQLQIPDYPNSLRLSQWLGSRVLAYMLLQKFTALPLPLRNNAQGKPEFEQNAIYISISHSQNLAAVIISERFKVGIDIENISPKVMRVRDKFMAAAEKTDAGEDLEKTLIYWSTKETLYKLYSKKQLLFKEHLLVKPFPASAAGTLEAQIQAPDLKKTYCIYYEKFKNHILTYCIDD